MLVHTNEIKKLCSFKMGRWSMIGSRAKTNGSVFAGCTGEDGFDSFAAI